MTVTQKIARLVAEQGWNQEAFARKAGLNRITVRQILTRPTKRLRNQTLRQCADALGLPVNDLLTLPLDTLLARVRNEPAPAGNNRRLSDLAGQPELQPWLERNPERARQLTDDEIDELLSLQGAGGPLTQFGVEHFVRLIERKRELRKKIDVVVGTEYIDLLEQIVHLLYEKVQA